MKISAHCNITNPETNGYPYLSSIRSFANFCDEVVIVDGGSTDGSLEKIREIPNTVIVKGEKWERDFDWTIMGKNLQIGYEVCKNDWAFHFDVDYIFHEDNVVALRKEIEQSHSPVLTLLKANFVLSDEHFDKNRVPLLVHKKNFRAVGYGIGLDRKEREVGTYLRPIIKQKKRKDGLWEGLSIDFPNIRLHKTSIRFYVYDFTFMTEEQVREQRIRFEGAVSRFMKRKKLFDKEAFDSFIGTMKHRHEKCFKGGKTNMELKEHSKFIRERIKGITPEMFGYNGFGYKEFK